MCKQMEHNHHQHLKPPHRGVSFALSLEDWDGWHDMVLLFSGHKKDLMKFMILSNGIGIIALCTLNKFGWQYNPN